jgi:two-component system, NtrC family, sensor kinase
MVMRVTEANDGDGLQRAGERARVLLVEDDPEVLESLANLLGEQGYQVATAYHGRQALEKLASAPAPDVIVLDLMMPVMNGWEFRAAQRADPALADIPVVAITADNSPQAAAIHAERVLAKPFAFGDLQLAIERVLIARERRLMMAKLEQTERLAALGTIAAGVAHEIGNPLSYTVANLALIDEELPILRSELEQLLARCEAREREPATCERLCGRIEELAGHLQLGRAGAERVRLIVRNLQGLSRRAEERHGALDLARVLDAAVALAWNQIRFRARLKRSFADVPLIFGSEPQLVQVFVNLLVNAGQAIPDGGRESHEVEVRTFTEKGWAVVEVRDTGGGMSEPVRRRIFEPFFTTKGAGEGTGLGLWISRDVVTAHGGQIEVESTLGAGSVFRVRLPIPAEAAAPPPSLRPPEPSRAASATRPRVWVVDDEPMVASTLARVLALHYDVTVAKGGGQEILDRLERGERFDVLLCDLMMPEMTGMELWSRLESRWPALAQRVLFLTGGAFTAEARAFLAAHPEDCLEKPFELPVLRRRVDALAGRGSAEEVAAAALPARLPGLARPASP